MCADGETSPANCLHLMAEADSSISEHVIKIRKPYIITKQRERWTDEEHNKFLEALKLYGRAWRRIEEHIGSKNTVQIRSHAQKFFSKVTRESSINSPGTVKAIEIPPPRPKRKPNHPYPRKLGHLSIKKGSVIDEHLWSSVSKQSISEQESKSPTSVLSAFGSDMIGTNAADTIKPCMSQVSSVDKTVTVEEIMVQQGIGSKSSSTSDEYKCNQSTVPSSSLSLQDASPMELELGIQNSSASKEAPVTGQQIRSLKLFGRTVIVADLHEQYLINNNELEHQDSFTDSDKISQDSQKLQEKPKSHDTLKETIDECNLFYGGISPMAYCLSSHENLISPVKPNMVSFPSWWNLYGTMPFYFSGAMNPTIDQNQPHSKDDQFVHYNPNSNETSQANSRSTSDSNSDASDSDVQVKELTPALVLKPSKNSAFISLIPSSSNSTKGFVPYKRCMDL